jgi:hypothetical protein
LFFAPKFATVFLVDIIQLVKAYVHKIFMNFVEPIRDRKKIAQIKNLLRGEARFRDLLLFVVGINTALRISDLLELQVGHFLDDQQHIKPRFWIKEQKRGKRQEVVVNASIRETLEEYFSAYPELISDQNNFIIFNTKVNGFMQPIKRGQAWKIPQRLTAAITVGSPAPFDLPGVKGALSKEERQQYDIADKMPWLFRLFLWKFARDARKNPASIHAMFANAAEADKSLLTQPGVRRAFENMINGAFEQGTRAATYDWALLARPWGFSLKEIKMPVHIWQGEADTFIPVKHAHVLAEAIPNARPRYFPNEGHVLIVTHFEELLNLATS